MGKTISLKLNSSEEEMINKMLNQGISPSKILRRALSNYFNSIDKKVNLFQQEENSIFDKKVNLSNRSEVNQVNQKVNLPKENEVNLEVNQNEFFCENKEKKKVNQKVNLVNQFEEKYLNLYIQQLKDRVNQLEKEALGLKETNKTNEHFLIDNYQVMQNEYHSLVKDTIKRIDDKFDRIMFYLEGSFKKPDYQVSLKSDFKDKRDVLSDKIKEEEVISSQKPKNGWVFKMYRM